ncbi:MAG: YbjN domain-containing protein [Hyphomonadaceae bacterium]
MDLWLDDETEVASDPMETVEGVISADERFQCERAEDGDVHFSFKCSWGESVGYFSYRHELPALLFTMGFDIQAAQSRRTEAVRLAGLINENLWLGHFDVWSDDGTIIFRHAMPMIGRDEISVGEVQAMLAAAMDAAERFQPAFHFLILGGMSADDAAQAALFEVSGEA